MYFLNITMLHGHCPNFMELPTCLFIRMPMRFATEWQVSDNCGRPRLVCVHGYMAIVLILFMVEGAYKRTHTHTHPHTHVCYASGHAMHTSKNSQKHMFVKHLKYCIILALLGLWSNFEIHAKSSFTLIFEGFNNMFCDMNSLKLELSNLPAGTC